MALRWLAFAPFGAYVTVATSRAQVAMGPAARPIARAEDRCPACGMAVMDARFAGQALTDGGRTLVYDAVECMADHRNGHAGPAPTIAVAWLADRALSTAEEARWLASDDATILFHRRLRTPMGGGLVALPDIAAALTFAGTHGLADATLLTWDEVVSTGVDRPWVQAQ